MLWPSRHLEVKLRTRQRWWHWAQHDVCTAKARLSLKSTATSCTVQKIKVNLEKKRGKNNNQTQKLCKEQDLILLPSGFLPVCDDFSCFFPLFVITMLCFRHRTACRVLCCCTSSSIERERRTEKRGDGKWSKIPVSSVKFLSKGAAKSATLRGVAPHQDR